MFYTIIPVVVQVGEDGAPRPKAPSIYVRKPVHHMPALGKPRNMFSKSSFPNQRRPGLGFCAFFLILVTLNETKIFLKNL